MKENKWLFIGASIIHVLALLLTYSRASYLSFIVVACVFAWKNIHIRRIVILLIAIFLISIILLPRPRSEGARLERLASVRSRIDNSFSVVQQLSLKTIFIGNGWYITNSQRQINNTNTEISHSSSPDNSFLHILESTGIFGLVSYVMFGIFLFRKSKIDMTKACILSIAVASFFNNVLFYPWMIILFGMMIAHDKGLLE